MSPNKLEIVVEEGSKPSLSREFIERYLARVLEFLDIHGWELSVLFCSDATMTHLNHTYRKKNEPTDVLSFSALEAHDDAGEDPWPVSGSDADARGTDDAFIHAGDIVIDCDFVKMNADYFGVKEEDEVRRVLVHGVLHLCGMDHQSNGPSEPMLVRQEQILSQLESVTPS